MPVINSLPNPNSHYISLGVATTLTQRFLMMSETLLDAAFQNNDTLPHSETFNRVAIDQLLQAPGCAGMRVSFGLSELNQVHVILTAVNASNEDLLPSVAQKSMDDDFVIVERGQRCPPSCPPSSPLNI